MAVAVAAAAPLLEEDGRFFVGGLGDSCFYSWEGWGVGDNHEYEIYA